MTVLSAIQLGALAALCRVCLLAKIKSLMACILIAGWGANESALDVLTHLDLGNNPSLQGYLPDLNLVASMPNLQWLDIGGASMTGTTFIL